MAANPNPSRITAELWRLWETTRAVIPGVRLGGIYANKSGYHNTVAANMSRWPGNYSIRFPLDTKHGPRDKSRGVDWTMSAAEMRKRTGYLRRSALDPKDHRLAAMREFYGTLDGKVVYGLIKDDADSSWRRSTADSSHLWHIHGSIFAAYVDDWEALAGIASVMSGETLAEWNAKKEGGKVVPHVSKGDRGSAVDTWQRMLRAAGHSPGEIDGEYGPKTAAAVRAFRVATSDNVDPGGDSITGWTAFMLMTRLFGGAATLPKELTITSGKIKVS